MTRNPYHYGWKPDLPDQRDVLYRTLYKIPKTLPAKADLRLFCPPIENQGQLGSCTAHALTGALEVLEKIDQLPVVQMSRLFVYYNERFLENTVDSDNGASLRDGIKTLVKQGACSEGKWPYDISKFAKKPTAACFKEGLNHQITEYQRLQTLNEMKTSLAQGFPFVFGFSVYESFESATVAKTGKAPMPKMDERVLGGHAVLAVGYDDAKKRLIVRNSWGEGWGMKGYFTLPYEYVEDANLAADFWVIRRGELM